MVIFTAKLTRRKTVTALLVMCIAICSLVAGIFGVGRDDVVSVSDETPTLSEGRRAKTNEDRIAILRECGWEVDSEPLEFSEVRIPEKFDGVYTDYNGIQKRQGMDLSSYCGKRVMRYTYKVNNYPNGERGVVANMIVYKDKLIGGDISSPKLGGFMHGFLENSENMRK